MPFNLMGLEFRLLFGWFCHVSLTELMYVMRAIIFISFPPGLLQPGARNESWVWNLRSE